MPTFYEFVAETLAQPAPPCVHRYLVVDTAATRPLNVSRSCGLGPNGVDLLTGAPCAWRNSASPILITLPSDSASPGICKKTRETLRLWRYANCFLYFESFHLPETIGRMLRNRTDALLPQNLPVLLRYFDARIFSVLTRVLTQTQRDSFLAIASPWAWPDRSGNLNSLRSNHLHEDSFGPPIVFNTDQEAALIDSGEVDAMIDILLNQSNRTLMTLLPPDQFERIHDALACARSFGIDKLTDQVAFCSLALELGAGFVTEHPWSEELLALSNKQLTFTNIVDRAIRREKP